VPCCSRVDTYQSLPVTTAILHRAFATSRLCTCASILQWRLSIQGPLRRWTAMDDDDEAADGAPAASTVLPHSPARSDDIFSDDSPPPPAAAAPAPAPTAAPPAALGDGVGALASAIPGKPAVVTVTSGVTLLSTV
jgi:hypothetical protein